MKFLAVVVAALALLAVAPAAVQAADWAVLVAGSSGYDNYRHQADIAHAYQLVHGNGIPHQNIITFAYDDIANDPSNPFPGKLFNKPTAAGTPGVDVYNGFQKDYTGAMVTPENFIAVITGNASALPAGSKVLQSTAQDRVFINFADHGGTGLIAFPSEYLYATDLINALNKMYQQKMYKRLVFYIEACEAGSMFDGILPPNVNIYATTASNPSESSWGTYCPPQDMVNGVELNSCLGDLYSVNWMENSDLDGPSEPLEVQYTIVTNETTQSHVMQYGDLTWTNEATGDYIGEGAKKHSQIHRTKKHKPVAPENKPASHVDSRDVSMHLAYYRYLRSEGRTTASKAALAALRAQLDARELAEDRFTRLAQLLSMDRGTGVQVHNPEHLFNAPATPVHSGLCVKNSVRALKQNGCDYDDFSLQFHHVIVNACAKHAEDADYAEFVAQQIQKVCA